VLLCLFSVCEVLRLLRDSVRRHSDTDGVVMATDDAWRERYAASVQRIYVDIANYLWRRVFWSKVEMLTQF